MGRKGLVREAYSAERILIGTECGDGTGVTHPKSACGSDAGLSVPFASSGPMHQPADLSDILHGVSAVAAHLGISEGSAWNLFEAGTIPAWIDGRTLCASRSAIDRTFVEREAAIRAAIVAGHE